jgi:hypothetical protein
VIIVFRHYARTEFPESFQLILDAIASQVEMDAVLDDLWLGYPLEEDPRPAATRRLDQDARVVLRVKDALTAQPRELRLIVRSDLVTVEDGGPEPGDRRGMAAIKYNIVKASHGHILPQPQPQPQPAPATARSSPRTHAAISTPCTQPELVRKSRSSLRVNPKVNAAQTPSGRKRGPTQGPDRIPAGDYRDRPRQTRIAGVAVAQMTLLSLPHHDGPVRLLTQICDALGVLPM